MADRDPTSLERTVAQRFRRGDTGERVAILRGLHALQDPVAALPVALDGCRSNVQDVFEAIACENPYPARYFPDPAFGQLVLKALFLGVALARVEGLAARVTPELRRMVDGFASERRAAGRPVPADVALVLGGDAGRGP